MLHVHRADRADVLVEALGALLAEPQPDPFAPEVVAVPTRGMERWLTQRLSGVLGTTAGRTDGVCANVAFPSPHQVVTGAIAAASGIDPQCDPWVAERMVWPLLEVVDGCLAEPWLAVLAVHLDPGRDGGTELGARRFGVVRHLAGLFDRYGLHRPELLRAWAIGSDAGSPWQSELWRRLRERIGSPSIAERLADAAVLLREDPALLDLPDRLALFGLTRLPAGQLTILRAISARRDVHLFLLHPSPALWERISETAGAPIVERSEDHTATVPANRLLASWGQDARELQLVLADAGADGAADHHHPCERARDFLLRRIQADVQADAPAPGSPLPGDEDLRTALDPGDRSLQVHACHGRARQVEILRDALLHLLQDDDSLEPRDIIVMCPDIETFAPLIHATFGAGQVVAEEDADEPGGVPAALRTPDLRVRLADRSLRQTNAVLGVVAGVLELAQRRLTASQVLDLADREPVRRRFGFDDDDLARIQDWVAQSGIRWGLDAAHRQPYKLDRLAAGTWRAGLDRVLLGVAMTEDGHRLYGDTLPLDDVESGAIDLAGRLSELVDRLGAALDALKAPKTLDAWAQAITETAQSLTATTPRDAWQQAELQRVLDAVLDEARASGSSAALTLSLPEVRALLAGRLEGRPTRANFRTGHLTVCTLMPMRSVPHRVVCLLGLDDDVFPRRSPRDGDDLMLDDPHVGERDARSEDRQLLLDALMAATDRLIVTYTGNDERTNVVRPPAVPIGELLDTVDRTARTNTARPTRARDHVVIRHPLQPFDPRNFIAGELRDDRVWSFDAVTLQGARALTAQRREPRPFLAGPLPDRPPQLVELDHLVRFLERPVRAFLRVRLGITLGDYSDEVDDTLAVELDHLEAWAVGRRLLDARLAGTDLDEALAAERARGSLPPGALAAGLIATVRPRVEAVAASAIAATGEGGEAESVDVKVALGGGRTLSGTVPGVHGDLLRTVTYSRVNPRHRLAAWVRWLALTAARPQRPFEAVTVGRSGARDAEVTIARIPPPPGGPQERRAFALAHLARLVDLFDRGMREPAPLACLTSAAYARAAAAGVDAAKAARGEWESRWNFDKEDKELDHQLVLGGLVAFADLLDQAPRDDERGEGWEEAEPTRFGRYARRLWAGLLACEELSDT
ncbi:MAG: exodeoxyribonuclease V subunit gamma [Solirubrobacteraceae bacterium MAG38_C4-C5]|nr:exodeoxyribonuclease V subunit gamma [Candidatus Siliceabacter maunaloa]